MSKTRNSKRAHQWLSVVREAPQSYADGGTPAKRYDLEERTYLFAKRIRAFVKKLARTIANIEDVKQLVRASGSVGANYIEANEALSKKDFVMRIKISRKESKESRFFLRLVDTDTDQELDRERDELVQESTELMNICGAIYRKSGPV